jgi:hypothetical protein
MRGWHVALTGDRMRPEGFDHPSHTMTVLRPTLDQYVATHEQFYGKAPPRFRSLVLGVSEARFHDYGHWNAISYSGPDSPIAPVMSPGQLYSLLFDVPGDLVDARPPRPPARRRARTTPRACACASAPPTASASTTTSTHLERDPAPPRADLGHL